MYYTTFSGGVNVHKVDFNYNGTNSFALTNNTGLASIGGADVIVFTSDGFLAVGGQGSTVYRVNPANGSSTSQSTGGPAAFHMSVAPDGSILAASIPGQPVKFNSTLTNNGTPLTFAGGSDSVLDTIVFDSSGQGWYTDSSSGGNGNFGKVNFSGNTYTTVRTITGAAATHGAAYDSFSNTIITFGAGTISQISVSTGQIIHSLTGFAGTFDQGAVDGAGHIFAANNDGNLTFIDYSNSPGNLSAAQFVNTQFLANSLDDVAPLSGLGSSGVPEPSTMALLGAGGLSWVVYRLRRRKQAV